MLAHEQEWAAAPCAELVASPPSTLLGLIQHRMHASQREAANRARSGGKMECNRYGPCDIGGRAVTGSVTFSAASRVFATTASARACSATSPVDVLRRLCAQASAIDEPLYRDVRARFAAAVERAGRVRVTRAVRRLRTVNQLLHERAQAQARVSTAMLERISGTKLQAQYVSYSGGRVPWRVDETKPS